MTAPLQKVLDKINEINSQDPNMENVDGIQTPKELVYGQRMTQCLNQYWPTASELLQIAVRAQHIKRWHIKRSEYPMGKAGYLNWRKALGQFHANLTKEVMLTCGYNHEDAEQAGSIVRKENFRSNPESQTLEDVACLVFLMYYFEPFAAKHSEEKIISIVQKTWKKMSAQAKDIALTLVLPAHLQPLMLKALS